MNYDIIQKPPYGRREGAEYYVTPVYKDTMNEKEIAKAIEKANSLTYSDVVGTISALTAEIAKALAQGRKVSIAGLGTFRLQLTTPKKDLQATDKVAKKITVRSVAFSPESDFKERFADVSFTRTSHSRTLRRVEESDALLEKLRTHFKATEFVRREDIQLLGHCGRTRACEFLRAFVSAGYLVNVGTKHSPLYRAAF